METGLFLRQFKDKITDVESESAEKRYTMFDKRTKHDNGDHKLTWQDLEILETFKVFYLSIKVKDFLAG